MSETGSNPHELNILTWNISNSTSWHDINRQLVSAEDTADIASDVVCLQEVVFEDSESHRDVSLELRAGRLLGEVAVEHVFRRQPFSAMRGHEALVTYSTLAQESQVEELSRNDVLMRTFCTSTRRVALVSELQPPSWSEGLTVINTHLSFGNRFRINERQRRSERDNLLDIIRSKADTRLVVAGDINDEPDSKIVKELRRHLRPANSEFYPTHLGRSPGKMSWQVHDYIFLSSSVEGRARTLPRMAASDHVPLLASICPKDIA